MTNKTIIIILMVSCKDINKALIETNTVSHLLSDLIKSVEKDLELKAKYHSCKTKSVAQKLFQSLHHNQFFKFTLDDDPKVDPKKYSKSFCYDLYGPQPPCKPRNGQSKTTVHVTNYGLASFHGGLNRSYLTNFCHLLVDHKYSLSFLAKVYEEGDPELYNNNLKPSLMETLEHFKEHIQTTHDYLMTRVKLHKEIL